MLAFPPSTGVETPEPGLDPAFIPKLRLGCDAPVFPDPNIEVVPAPDEPPNIPLAGFEVAGEDCPKTEELPVVLLVPKIPGLEVPEVVPPPPIFPKVNPDIL